ncbi:MAG: hypothetical protein WD054_07165, partial [Gemmatimonadota bacterium]
QPQSLEDLFSAWEQAWYDRNEGRAPGEKSWDWNNPKIPVVHVRDVGQLIYGAPPVLPRKVRPRKKRA